MMNVKTGTQNWSKAASEPGFKTDGTQNMSAPEREQALGGENLGEVLNKVADANYVDPAKSRKVGNNQLDKDAFLKLMLTQMKFQDPTNPMQSHEMAAQLAQFTSLEQLNNINSTLTSMKQTQSPTVNYQALNFIGKRVSGDSSKLQRTAGDTDHEFNFNLGADAAKVKVAIHDGEGNVVRTLEVANFKKGPNAIKWNGLTDEGSPARPGDYRFEVEATASNGNKIFAKTEFDGRITGLNYTPSGPVLMVGQQSIRMQDVKKIEEASAESAFGSGVPMPLAPQEQTEGVKPEAKTLTPAQAKGQKAAESQLRAGEKQNVSAGAQNSNGNNPLSTSLMKNVSMSRPVMEALAKNENKNGESEDGSR